MNLSELKTQVEVITQREAAEVVGGYYITVQNLTDRG